MTSTTATTQHSLDANTSQSISICNNKNDNSNDSNHPMQSGGHPSTAVSVLVIGAFGRTGRELIRELAFRKSNGNLATLGGPVSPQTNQIDIHAFCRGDPDSKDDGAEIRSYCTSVIQGDAGNSADVERALQRTNANWIIVSIGNGDSVKKCAVRTESANAIVAALKKSEYQSVRVAVVSSTGAGPSRIIVGMGIGSVISYYLRHILRDHTGQEVVFQEIADRVVIVRATALTDHQATGKLVVFGDNDKSPSIKTDRKDLARWIVQEILLPGEGRIVNVTGIK